MLSSYRSVLQGYYVDALVYELVFLELVIYVSCTMRQLHETLEFFSPRVSYPGLQLSPALSRALHSDLGLRIRNSIPPPLIFACRG